MFLMLYAIALAKLWIPTMTTVFAKGHLGPLANLATQGYLDIDK